MTTEDTVAGVLSVMLFLGLVMGPYMLGNLLQRLWEREIEPSPELVGPLIPWNVLEQRQQEERKLLWQQYHAYLTFVERQPLPITYRPVSRRRNPVVAR